MQSQFDALGLDACRIEAVTPSDLSDADKARYCNPARILWLQETEISCLMSHFAALRELVASRESYAAIFEDDVVLSSALPEFLAAFEAAPPATELLRLETDNKGVRLSPDRSQKLANFSLVKPRGPTSGSAGYIVSRQAAIGILESVRVMQVPVDHSLFNPYEKLAERYDMRHLEPALCIQMDRIAIARSTASQSDLEKHRNVRPFIEKKYPLSRFLRSVCITFEREILIGPRQTFYALTGAKKHVVPFLDADMGPAPADD